MAAVTICNDFEAPKNKVSHCFHCFPITSWILNSVTTTFEGQNLKNELALGEMFLSEFL